MMRSVVIRILIGIWGVIFESWVTSWRGSWGVVVVILSVPVVIRGSIVWWMVIETWRRRLVGGIPFVAPVVRWRGRPENTQNIYIYSKTGVVSSNYNA